MTKLVRNLSNPESVAFWQAVERSAATVKDLPAWVKSGVVLRGDRDDAPDDAPAGKKARRTR
jgi:hypothetical protein